MRIPGLRTEILIHLGVLLAAALTLMGLVQVKLAEQEILRLRLETQVDQVALLAEALTPDHGRAEGLALPARLDRLLALLPDELGGVQLRLLDAAGQELYAEGTWQPEDAQQARHAYLLRTPDWRYVPTGGWRALLPGAGGVATVAAPLGGEAQGVVQVRFVMADIWPRRWQAVNLLLIYGLSFGVCLLLFGYSLLSKTVLRPVRRLQQATRKVAGQQFSDRIEHLGAREWQELGEAFNAMTLSLADEQQRTRETIHSLQQANDDIRQAQDALLRSEKMASVGHLAAGMAHEIGNPLGATIGYLNLLLNEPLPEAQRDILQRSLTELARIDRLIRDLLDYAASDSAQAEPVDPAAVLREAAELLTHQGALKEVVLDRDLPAALPPVRIARHKLLQVLVNLLLNARDALDDAPAERCIRLRAVVEGAAVLLQVQDSGCGMTEDTARHLFDPFFTTKVGGEGRGLGLAVSQRIVAEAGGAIRVQSTLGTGSLFEVSLPLAQEED